MEKINFDNLNYDTFTQSYPYIIEDCGISFIMYYNDIEFTDDQFFLTLRKKILLLNIQINISNTYSQQN